MQQYPPDIFDLKLDNFYLLQYELNSPNILSNKN